MTDALLEQEVHILWPDNGVWYGAVIKEVRDERAVLNSALDTIYVAFAEYFSDQPQQEAFPLFTTGSFKFSAPNQIPYLLLNLVRKAWTGILCMCAISGADLHCLLSTEQYDA